MLQGSIEIIKIINNPDAAFEMCHTIAKDCDDEDSFEEDKDNENTSDTDDPTEEGLDEGNIPFLKISFKMLIYVLFLFIYLSDH